MTIEEKIETALFSRVRTLNIYGAPPISWGKDFTPPAPGGPYIGVLLLPNRNTRLYLNPIAPHQRQGILQLTAVTPLSAGPSLATRLSGEIAAHFPADLLLFSDGLKVRIQKAPDPWPPETTDVSRDVQVDIYYEAFA